VLVELRVLRGEDGLADVLGDVVDSVPMSPGSGMLWKK
jgi:hypothetical protein